MDRTKIKLAYPISIIAYDAGSANILFHYVLNSLNINNCYFILGGPAIKIFKSLKVKIYNDKNLEKLISKSQTIISGTGWQSDLEHMSRDLAKKQKIKSIAILDHWKNYKKRFLRNNNLILPDEIWVFDKFAYSLAKKIFKLRIRLKKNYFYEYILKKSKKLKKKKSNKITYLYLDEPINQKKRILNPVSPFNFFLDNLYKIHTTSTNYEIIIRPHPSQDIKIFKKILRYANIKLNYRDSLLNLIFKSDVVIGCETAGLIIALKCKKIVYSSIPRGYGRLLLPYKGIKELRKII